MNRTDPPADAHRVLSASQIPRDRGAVLVIGLIVLVVMTILGLSGMRTSVLQELMAGQTKESNSAFHAAEAGMQAALNYLAGLRRPPDVAHDGNSLITPACEISDTEPTSCSLGQFHPCCLLPTVIASWAAYDPNVTGQVLAGRAIDALDGNALDRIATAQQPHFVIEHRFVPSQGASSEAEAGTGKGDHYFTVAAVGFDPGTNSRVILQTTILIPFL